jgi:hypothetical protein
MNAICGNPHKRVVADQHLAHAPDKWGALFDKLRKQRGFTREYNDRQMRQAAHARKKPTSDSVEHGQRRDKTLCIDGKEYTFSHTATTHVPTTINNDTFQWTNLPNTGGASANQTPNPANRLRKTVRKTKQPKPLGLHRDFKKHIIRHTNNNTDYAVLDVVYADHAVPKAFLAAGNGWRKDNANSSLHGNHTSSCAITLHCGNHVATLPRKSTRSTAAKRQLMLKPALPTSGTGMDRARPGTWSKLSRMTRGSPYKAANIITTSKPCMMLLQSNETRHPNRGAPLPDKICI